MLKNGLDLFGGMQQSDTHRYHESQKRGITMLFASAQYSLKRMLVKDGYQVMYICEVDVDM